MGQWNFCQEASLFLVRAQRSFFIAHDPWTSGNGECNGETVTYRYIYLCLGGCSVHFSSFMLHGAWITANGEWSSPLMESSRTSDPEYI